MKRNIPLAVAILLLFSCSDDSITTSDETDNVSVSVSNEISHKFNNPATRSSCILGSLEGNSKIKNANFLENSVDMQYDSVQLNLSYSNGEFEIQTKDDQKEVKTLKTATLHLAEWLHKKCVKKGV